MRGVPYLKCIYKRARAIIGGVHFVFGAGSVMWNKIASECHRVSQCSVVILHVHSKARRTFEPLLVAVDHMLPEF